MGIIVRNNRTLELHFFYTFFYFVHFMYLFQNYCVDRLKREMHKISVRDENKKKSHLSNNSIEH